MIRKFITKVALGLGFLSLTLHAQNDSFMDTSVHVDADVSTIDYVLQPLDLLQVRVFQEPSMDREVRMSGEASIMLPLIGLVHLQGKTIREAEIIVTDLYNKDYLVNPQVNLTVLEYARRTVNVLGSVRVPGEVEFPREEGLTLLEALARTGGFTRLADRRKVKLTRELPSGDLENYIINIDDIIKGDVTKRWILKTGDIIYVPERIF